MNARKYSRVSIDGISYVPATERPLGEQARALLNEVYGRLWTEAHYDPWNEQTKKFAQPLADKMSELNKLLGFKA
jgi:hypothetical protein